MERNGATFSSLTTGQIEDLQALERKFNSTSVTNQETVLIAYTKPEQR